MIRKAGQSVLSNIEKAIYSYNNAIDTLNAVCEEYVGNTNSDILDVRCVGSNPEGKGSKNITLYTSTRLQNNPTSSQVYAPGSFDSMMYGQDSNYSADFDRMVVLRNIYIRKQKQ